MTQPTTLGSYVVERELGRGGMGVVYLARDPRLNRLVALKVLSAELGRHPDHLARFEREAKHLAALNHPNIAAIYGIEDVEVGAGADVSAEHQRLLVLEYVPGDTLAQRLKFGSLPTGEALEYCRQIALALEAAHDNGVIHRDLKPGNVAITPDGQVKVLDFGLAKGGAASASDVDLALSPTFTYTPTAAGVILGTAAYMSPEQARGKPVDKRTDIWAFGCVLFESLTGRQFFQGETVSDTIARILERDPDWSLLPSDTPPKIRELLRRCLEKDVKKRQRDIGDARIEIEEAISARASASRIFPGVPLASNRSFWLSQRSPTVWLTVGLVAGVGLLALTNVFRTPADSASTLGGPYRVSINFPGSIRALDAGISPDGGSLLVYGVARNTEGTEEPRPRAYVRRLDSYEFKPLPGTDGIIAAAPSPDGRWLAFISPVSDQSSERRVSKVPIDGSAPPVALADWHETWGNSFIWLEDGDLLIASKPGDQAEFFRLPTGGGARKSAVKVDSGSRAVFPSFVGALPGGRAVFAQFASWGANGYQEEIWLLDPATGKASLLLENAGRPYYVPTGHIVFSRHDTLYAVPFDLRTHTRGDIVALTGGMRTPNSWAPGQFAVSRSGTLMYAPGGRVGIDRQLVIVDANGMMPFVADRRGYETPPSVSADGRRAAIVVPNDRGTYEIWIAERDRSIRRLIAFPDADAAGPLWSPDGRYLAYQRTALTPEDGVYIARVDSGASALALKNDSHDVFLFPVGWTHDTTGLVIQKSENGRSDLLMIPISSGTPGAATPFRATTYNDIAAEFSPDGKLVAFVAEDSGRAETYVARLQNGAIGQSQLVPGGGCGRPSWTADSKQLYFCDRADKIRYVSVVADPLTIAAPVEAYDLRKLRVANWDLLPDGRLFAIQKGTGEDDISSVNIVFNWFDELRARLGAR